MGLFPAAHALNLQSFASTLWDSSPLGHSIPMLCPMIRLTLMTKHGYNFNELTGIQGLTTVCGYPIKNYSCQRGVSAKPAIGIPPYIISHRFTITGAV